jgi:hypothetical protein
MILLFIVIVGFTHQVGETEDLTHLNESLNWSKYNERFSEGSENIIADLIYKFVDALGYIVMTGSKAILFWSVNNPQIDYILLFKILITVIILAAIVPVIKLLIICWVFFSDLIQSRKEKKELRRLKDARTK